MQDQLNGRFVEAERVRKLPTQQRRVRLHWLAAKVAAAIRDSVAALQDRGVGPD
jgi:hypothetical protein